MNLERLKRRLRGTFIHGIYAFLKYDLSIALGYQIYHNAKRGQLRKVIRLLNFTLKSLIVELPKSVAVDIVSCCNLRCPLCSVPPYITKRDNNFMSFEDFKRIVDHLEVTSNVSLVYAGEPFLHPDFLAMAKYASRRFYTATITNGTLLSSKTIEGLLDSGLDFLQVSFDGFSKASFEKYRVGANFENVKKGILKLIDRKRETCQGLPHVTITFLVHAYNEDEVEKCKEYFLRKGANRFFAKAINLNTHRRLDGKGAEELVHWLPKRSDITLYEDDTERIAFKMREQPCTICLTPIIRCDGEILLCCHDIFNTVKIGNVFEDDFTDIWFSERYKKIRQRAKSRDLAVCKKCGK